MRKYFRFFRSILSTKYAHQDLLKSFEDSFQKHKDAFPGYDPHFYLAQVWLTYKQASAGYLVDDPKTRKMALEETRIFACADPQKCARALGLWLLNVDRPEIFEEGSSFEAEFEELVMPLISAKNNGTAESIYKQYNPNMERQKKDL